MADEEENKVEVQASESEEENKGGVTVGGVHISEAQLPMVGVFFSGLILLIAVGVAGRGIKWWAYGISLPSVAMFFSLVGICLTFSKGLNEKVGKFNCIFLFLWCFVGACIMTFSGPFQTTSNGYFASWGLAIFSVMGVGVTIAALTNGVLRMGAMLGLMACSIIVVVAIIPQIRDWNYRNQGIYALSAACVTILVTLIFMKVKANRWVKFGFLAFFAVIWIVLACIVTFQGPFLLTGNGYFGSWGGAVCAVFAAMESLKEGQGGEEG